MSQYIHHVPGRLRVRSAAFRCQSGGTATAAAQLRTVDGVTEVRLNPRAGSLTVLYDCKRLQYDDLLSHMQVAGCYHMPITIPAPRSSSYVVASRAGRAFGKALVGAVVNKAVERSAFKLVSVLL